MKKIRISPKLLLIFFFSLIPFLPIFLNCQMLHTHDGPVHLARMAAWFKSFYDGQIPPRWAADLNFGYGTPVLIFMYPWPYFLATLLLSLGLGLVITFKLVLVLSFIFSGVFMYLFGLNLFKDGRKAFLVAIFYQFASFRFSEILIRGSFGEVWAYTFAPLALLGLTKIFARQRLIGFLICSLGVAFMILSHNSVSLSFFGALVLFILIFGQKILDYFWGGLSLIFGLALSSFYWLPAIWERKYTYGDLFMKNLYLEHFPTLKQLLLPNFLNTASSQVGDVPIQIGIFHLLGLLLGIVLLIKKKLTKKETKILIFSLIVFLISIFFMQKISLPFWEKFSLLRQFQFSWRLLSLVVLATSLSGVIFLSVSIFKKNNFYWLLIFLVILVSVGYWRPSLGFDQVNENDYWYYPLNTTYFGEADTIWAAGPPKEYPAEKVKIIDGKGEVAETFRSSTNHRFAVNAETEINILDRTLFFPGWRVFVDGQPVTIEFQDQNYRGLITFKASSGAHEVEVIYGRTKDRTMAEIISLGSAVSVAILSISLFLQRRKKLSGRYL